MQGIDAIRVSRDQAEHFAKVWKTPSGLHIHMPPASIQFAADFANIVLYSFIEQAARQAEAAKQQKPEIPLVVAEEGC